MRPPATRWWRSSRSSRSGARVRASNFVLPTARDVPRRPYAFDACLLRGAPVRVRVCARRIAKRPRGMVARSNPVPEAERALEFLVYGRFKFDDTDADGVDRLGTEWVPVEAMALDDDWCDKVADFENAMSAMREAFE